MNEKRKAVRLQLIGFAQLLAMPMAMLLCWLLQMHPNWGFAVIFFLVVSGYCFIMSGHDKMLELKSREKEPTEGMAQNS